MNQKNKIRLLNCCLGTWVVLSLIFIFMGLFFLDGLIQNMAQESIKMANDTYQIWGEVPGKTQTVTIRNCTLYNLSNSDGFIYRQEVPIFNEKSNFVYQEESEFVNYKYKQNDELLEFDYWLFFDQYETSRDVNETSTLINLAPLGFWSQLDSVPIYTFTLQGFGGLFLELNETIKQQALGQGISQQFLGTYEDFQYVCFNVEIEERFCKYLWEDRFYGMNNDANVQIWVAASYYDDDSSKDFLMKYFFPFPIPQFKALLETFKEWSLTVDYIISNWYCGSKDCDRNFLAISQLSQGSITNNPPAGGDPAESICSLNSTCVGSPEIPVFLHNEFKEKYPDERYQILTFSVESVSKLFVANQGLLNIGSLEVIFSKGEAYDKDKTEKSLSALREILGMETNDHAFVVWEWIKYMTEDFVLKKNKDGTRKIAGLGGLFSQAFYQSTYQFSSWFLEDIFAWMAHLTMHNCTKYFEENFGFLSPDNVQSMCKNVSMSNYSTYYSLLQPCISYQAYSKFQKEHNLSQQGMQSYCDIDSSPSHIGKLLIDYNSQLAVHYNCTESMPKKCTQIDLIIKQAFFSSITLDPWNDYPFKNVTSAIQWNKDLRRFEYQEYLKVAMVEDSQIHTEAELRDMFSFDKLLSGPTVQEIFIQKNEKQFKNKYYWNSPKLLRNYIRFVTIEAGFGGFVQQRSAQEWFFGYVDPFLETFKNTDPMQGGDPSLNPVIMLNQPNSTKQQAKLYPQQMWTGYKDVKYTRNYHQVYEKPFITYNHTYFNGKDIIVEFISPWAEDIVMQGSDGFQNPPGMAPDEQCNVYLTTLCRFGSLYFNDTVQKYGFTLHDFRLNESFLQSMYDNPENVKYYQGYGGFLNLSFQGFPAFVSKNHFLDAPQNWSDLIQIYDESGQFQMKANRWDDSYILMEPITGASFTATIFLQSSYHYVPDILFPQFQQSNKTERMLPMFSVYRSGNMSQDTVEEYFGDLKTALSAKRGFVLIGLVALGIMALLYCACRLTEVVKPIEKESLLQSQRSIPNEEQI